MADASLLVRLTAAAAFALPGSQAAGQATPASLEASPSAQQLFERDWVLMNWALKHFDADHDILLQPNEAEAAAEQFRRIADADGDGRVTQQEYRAARESILARD
jgi:hypothetical protein